MTDTERISELPALPFPSPSLTPPAEYAERRATCPLGQVRLPSGHPAILLVTYRDVAAAVAEPRLSHDLTGPDAPRMTAEPSFLQDPDIILNKDGADHLRMRRIVAAAFTPRRAERWKPVIRQIAHELIDDLEKGGKAETDLVAGYCFPLPVRIICRLLGVPERDALSFRHWSSAFAAGARMEPQEREAAIGAFLAYTAELIAARRADPGEDLIDDLIAARDGADKLSEHELLTLVTGLIAAGNETTATALSRFLVELLSDDRKLWRQLLAQPELLPAAVDELLRFTGLSNSTLLRLAVEDVELPSGTVKAGQVVAIPNNAALRDPEAYPDPDTIRFDRDAPPTLIFGGGPHYCLGAHLAKAELTVGLEVLLQRLPTLRMTVGRDDLEFSGGEIIDSMISLPVAW